MLEAAGQPSPMGVGVLAWLLCGLGRALLFVSLSDAGFAADVHVRTPVLALSAACCYATAALHLYAMVGSVSTQHRYRASGIVHRCQCQIDITYTHLMIGDKPK